MVIINHPKLSIRHQCGLLQLSRSTYYKEPHCERPETLKIMKRIDEIYIQHPYYGSRRLQYILDQEGVHVGRHRVRRLMRIMGIQAIYQRPRTSIPDSDHKVYPYLLRDLVIKRPNQVWCSDITYVPMKQGFMYLVAIMDWYSRKVLSWCLSNTLDVRFCIEALKRALKDYGTPEIVNTDQGCQYTSCKFTGILKEHGIRISMDGKGRWRDNVMIERLWRSIKYECLYLQEFDTIQDLRNSIDTWMTFYNNERPHATFNGRKPNEVYYNNTNQLAA